MVSPRTGPVPVGTGGPDPDDLARCVRCGLCLPHCPTFRVTGSEVEGPRGRIEAMRLWTAGHLRADRDLARSLETCVQCLACEQACPSAVPYHRLIAAGRAALREAGSSSRPFSRRFLDAFATHAVRRPGRLRALGVPLAAAGALGGRGGALGLPRLDPADVAARLPRPTRPGERVDALLLAGCVMHAWDRRTLRDALAVIAATGARAALTPPGCCGAISRHAGRPRDAQRLADRWWAAVADLSPGAPILSTSAGCTLELADGAATAGRAVRDVTTWLAERLGGDTRPPWSWTGRTLVLHDPCHLRAGGAHDHVAEVLAGAYRVRRPEPSPPCCGAGGTYAFLEPGRARSIRDAAARALRAAAPPGTGPAVPVASANPGCGWHLAGAGLKVLHPVRWLAAALDGTGHTGRGIRRVNGPGQRPGSTGQVNGTGERDG